MEFGDLESYFDEPHHAHLSYLKHHFCHSGFSVAQREGVPYSSFMAPCGIVIVLNFPPDSLWEKRHSCFPSGGNAGSFNDTLNSLLKLVSGLNHFSP